MPIKHKNGKEGHKETSCGLDHFRFRGNLKKIKKEGFLAESVEVIFTSTEVIPAPPSGFRVMFIAFLLRGFSLSAHEFLHGLLFIYVM
jgi:hypothetical protein